MALSSEVWTGTGMTAVSTSVSSRARRHASRNWKVEAELTTLVLGISAMVCNQ